MSADVVNLHAQVEAVLGTLVKAATVELIRLFEGGHRASAWGPDVTQRAGGKETSEVTDSLWTGDAKRSVGVQVDPRDICGVLVLPLHENCLKGSGEQQHGALGQLAGVDLWGRGANVALRERRDSSWTVDGVESRLCEAECPADGEAPTESVWDGTWCETLRHRSAQSSPAETKPQVVRLDTVGGISPPPVKAEPQQASVSTAGGSVYSPPPFASAEVGVGQQVHAQQVHAPKEANVKLELASPDPQLTRPCRVRLVDLLMVPESQKKFQDGDARGQNSKSRDGPRRLKDLRHHQGPHTGHRICCFSACGNGTWRLKTAVAHTQEGYVCGTCGKTFTRRKFLRRHQRFHTGEKPYSCQACSKTFVLRKSLRRHGRFHSGERPHVCPKCNKSFRLRENLRAHLRFHTGEKPYRCAACGKMFRIVRNLEKHRCHAAALRGDCWLVAASGSKFPAPDPNPGSAGESRG